uniref:LLM class F420-dependent oxidoreductase n=1 Tax=Thermosporothrix sp. COM3 TaxID=2490863 RepID=A0A455SI31_9CHLR|nr:LLM class F420-dependent oxidoreductase [Thermosporothrix sp. COM3]
MSIQLGVVLPLLWKPDLPVEACEHIVRVAQEVDRSGFASLWLEDHLISPVQPEQALFECWMTTAALARETERIRIGQLVTCNSFRHPALLAKMASTVDVLSHGRLTVGLGAGWFEREYRAYGYEYPDTSERVRQLREAAQVLLALWTQEEATFEGKYYRLRGAINQPGGVQQPHIPLLIGGKGEHATLKIVAQYADACNFTHLSYPSPEELQRKLALLRTYCEALGRDYRTIKKTLFMQGVVAETDQEAEALVRQESGKFTPEEMRVRGLLGSPETIRSRLTELEQAGVEEVMVVLRGVTTLEPLRLLATCLP